MAKRLLGAAFFFSLHCAVLSFWNANRIGLNGAAGKRLGCCHGPAAGVGYHSQIWLPVIHTSVSLYFGGTGYVPCWSRNVRGKCSPSRWYRRLAANQKWGFSWHAAFLQSRQCRFRFPSAGGSVDYFGTARLLEHSLRCTIRPVTDNIYSSIFSADLMRLNVC